MSVWLLKSLRKTWPPLLFFGLVVALWQLAVWWCDPPSFLVPRPWRVARAGIEIAPRIAEATALTATAAVCGFLCSLVVGAGIAFVFSQSAAIRRSCFPYAIFLQTVPIVAIAPLIITWSGYGLRSVILIASVVSLFPIITNATAGLLGADPALLELFQLHNASRWQLLTKLRLPNAVPHLVTGAKTSSGLAVVGAIVGEFFVGAGMGRFGLGYLIRQKLELLRTDESFAAVLASAVLGVAIFAAVNLAGATVLSRWYHPTTEDPDTT